MKGARFWAGMCAGGVAVFLLSFALRPFDARVGEAIVGAPGLVSLAGAFAFLGGISFVAPAVIVGSVALAYFGRWWGAARLLGSVGVAEVFSRTLKLVFGRARPDYILVPTGGFSFPSGHATLGAATAVLLVWFASRHVKGTQLVVTLLAVALAWAVGMAGSRLVLGVHYLSDVVGGIGLGTATASVVILATLVAEPRFTARAEARSRSSSPQR